jgi:hypothetical protein
MGDVVLMWFGWINREVRLFTSGKGLIGKGWSGEEMNVHMGFTIIWFQSCPSFIPHIP